MENASKALLIAGGILIAILILSLAVALISSYRSTSESYSQTMTTQQIIAFNTKFTKYIEYDSAGNMYISAYNLITIVNLAEEIRENNNIKIGFKSMNIWNEKIKQTTLKKPSELCVVKDEKYYIPYFKIDKILKTDQGKITEIDLIGILLYNVSGVYEKASSI